MYLQLALGWGGVVAVGMGTMGFLHVTARMAGQQRQLDDIQTRLEALESRIDLVARTAVATSYISVDTCPSACMTEINSIQDKVETLEDTTGTLTTTTGTLTSTLLNLQTSAAATCNKVCNFQYMVITQCRFNLTPTT